MVCPLLCHKAVKTLETGSQELTGNCLRLHKWLAVGEHCRYLLLHDKPPQNVVTYNNYHLFVHDSAFGTGLTWAVLQISSGVTHELVIFRWVDCSKMI